MFSLLDIRIGFYLAVRQLRRASRYTTALIVFVMLLTFLNLVVITGLLQGIVAGIANQYRNQEIGDVAVIALDTKNYIEDSPQVISFIKSLPGVGLMSARYIADGVLEANYQTNTDPNQKPDETGASIDGVDPAAEDAFGNLSHYIGEGQFLAENDYDQVVIGSQLIDRYSFGSEPGLTPLKNVYPGTKIRITVNGNTREFTVKGILVAPANSPIASKVFMPADELRGLMGRSDYNVNEIGIHLAPGTDPVAFQSLLLRSGIGADGKVETFAESIPNGIAQIQDTFGIIGDIIGSIGLVVASITIFIVIFINAITRRKFIGILQGIGISGGAIELSYVFQSIFYATIGAGIGLLLIYGFFVPYFGAHPLRLPVSDAIIIAPAVTTGLRVLLMLIATVIAGYIPARMIVRKNTLDSILGRA